MSFLKHAMSLWLILLSSACWAQDNSHFLPDADSLLTEEDSLSLFSLIDSLLNQPQEDHSLFLVRMGYNSNVLSAGRTLGIENFGLSPGLSYYHKSGAFADVSGYWSQDFQPRYYLTVLSAGYLYDVSKHLSVMGEYDHYFYQGADDLYIPYSNTLSVSGLLEFKPLQLSVNYAFYFGDTYAHRIQPGVSVRLQKKKWKGIDRLSLSPSFYTLIGDETLTDIRYPETVRELIRRLRQGLPAYEEVNRRVFGVMNYTISVPLTIMYKQWMVNFTYNYNIPQALPGEPLTLSESTYLSGSLSYYIPTKRRKMSL